MSKYDHSKIESKWQRFWKDNRTFSTNQNASGPKYYVLDMFPYPSGSGLHVGHLIGYTATDIVARYKRALGFNVLHPMGWDSFGLPAEQYAIRTGTHPRISTQANIDNFRKQLSALGFSYDPRAEFATSDPEYYRWTQKLFTVLYKKGLAYMEDVRVNYCPALGTVLSNEEVENGLSVEGGFLVEQRVLRQWMLRITAYADRLLNDLEEMDWPESIKNLQRNWIGKMIGLELMFSGEDYEISVFTTRPETIMGVTYIAVSPEHPDVDSLILDSYRSDCENFLSRMSIKSERDRAKNTFDSEGVFTGKYVRHPITGEMIPIWLAEYVSAGIGTGAVMGVPAHDENDCRFSEIYDISKKYVLSFKDAPSREPYFSSEGYCYDSNYGDFEIDGLSVTEASLYVINYFETNARGKKKIFYKLRDWLFSRQRYWGEPIPVIHFKDGSHRVLEDSELPLLPPEDVDYNPDGSGQGPLARALDWIHIKDPKTGKQAIRETHTMPQWAGSCWYFLRFCDPGNTEVPWSSGKESYWMPVDLYIGGAEHAVLHLLYSRFWHKVFYDEGLVAEKEPFKKLVNQGLVLSTSYRIPGGKYVNKDEVIKRGDDFFALSGEKLIVKTEKMSKSKLNGVDPMEIVRVYGADALRMYSIFSGPLEKNKVWSDEGVAGCSRFLNRFFRLIISDKVKEKGDGLEAAHRLVKKISHDIESLSLNTIPSSLMEFLNGLSNTSSISKKALEMAIRIMAPLTPHFCEEMWQLLGNSPDITEAGWPEYDESLCKDDVCVYVIQVNGKRREQVSFNRNASREEVVLAAKQMVSKYLETEIQNIVFVPGKLINFVVGPV
ncbi:MAG: leucine--tRNA ligase [Victivallaceae bacterium]